MSHAEAKHAPEPIRHFVVLIDGTWVSASSKDSIDRLSNIYKLTLYVETHNNDESQFCMYLPGLGSGTSGLPLTNGIFAPQLPHDVERAYINICMNYMPGDKIYLFGFSRGAVVARLVAGLIGEYGLLKPSQIEMFPLIWENFLQMQNNDTSITDKNKFRHDYCVQSTDSHSVNFLGVFDTVYGNYFGKDAVMLGTIFKGNRMLGKHVKSAVHILAMNETRSFFRPILFKGKESQDQKLEQIWMPGVHTDIGGGYPENFLSKISLLTMLQRISEYTPIKIDKSRVMDLKASIEVDLGENRIIVNDECKLLLWRLLSRISDGTRTVTQDDDGQYKHPIFRILDGRVFTNKSSKEHSTYKVPEFLTDVPEIEIATFNDFHERMI